MCLILKVGSQYDKNALDTMLKCKGGLDFYHCITNAMLDAWDYTCHKLITRIVCMKKHGDAAVSVHTVNATRSSL